MAASVLDNVKLEVARLTGVPAIVISEDGWLIEYGIDSVRALELVTVLEDLYEISIDDEALAGITTVSDVAKMVETISSRDL